MISVSGPGFHYAHFGIATLATVAVAGLMFHLASDRTGGAGPGLEDISTGNGPEVTEIFVATGGPVIQTQDDLAVSRKLSKLETLFAHPPGRPMAMLPGIVARPLPRPDDMRVTMSSRSLPFGDPGPMPRSRAGGYTRYGLEFPSEGARRRSLVVEANAIADAPPHSLREASGLTCLAVSLYHEARDQPKPGIEAVAAVIVNRAEASRWGDTVCEVVQPVQFSYLDDKLGFAPIEEPAAWRQALGVALDALRDGPADVVGLADHYHATYVEPTWTQNMRVVGRIGRHIFYRDPGTPEGTRVGSLRPEARPGD